MGVLSPSSNLLTEISKLPLSDKIFESTGLGYILKFKWEKYASKIYWVQAGMFFIFMILYTIGVIFIRPIRAEEDSVKWNVVSTIIFVICLLFLPWFIFHELKQFKL